MYNTFEIFCELKDYYKFYVKNTNGHDIQDFFLLQIAELKYKLNLQEQEIDNLKNKE